MARWCVVIGEACKCSRLGLTRELNRSQAPARGPRTAQLVCFQFRQVCHREFRSLSIGQRGRRCDSEHLAPVRSGTACRAEMPPSTTSALSENSPYSIPCLQRDHSAVVALDAVIIPTSRVMSVKQSNRPCEYM